MASGELGEEFIYVQLFCKGSLEVGSIFFVCPVQVSLAGVHVLVLVGLSHLRQ